MSSSSSGDRRTGGVARIRRTPDSARRTTSARPGASSPAAVWNWLIEDTHRVSVAGVYRHFPTAGLLRGRLRHVVRHHQRRAPATGRTRRSVAQVGEPGPVRPVRRLRVRRGRRVHRGQHLGQGLLGQHLRSGGSPVSAASSARRRRAPPAGPAAHSAAPADGRRRRCRGGSESTSAPGTASRTVSVTVHLPPQLLFPQFSTAHRQPAGVAVGVSERSWLGIARPGAGHLHVLLGYPG